MDDITHLQKRHQEYMIGLQREQRSQARRRQQEQSRADEALRRSLKELSHWEPRPSTGSRIKAALKFLFF